MASQETVSATNNRIWLLTPFCSQVAKTLPQDIGSNTVVEIASELSVASVEGSS